MKFRILLALVLLVVAATAFAGDRVPFQASLAATSLTVTPPFDSANPCPGPSLYFQITAVGQMSHLGLITDVQSHCLSLIPNPDGTLSFFNGQTTLTAANGDKIFGTYDGYVEVTADGTLSFFNGRTTLTAANGDKIFGVNEGYVEMTADGAIVHGSLTNTGGTGRFNGVAGDGTALGVEIRDGNGNVIGVALTLKGTMTTVGAAKRN